MIVALYLFNRRCDSNASTGLCFAANYVILNSKLVVGTLYAKKQKLCQNTLYHFKMHYIMSKQTISCQYTPYYAKHCEKSATLFQNTLYYFKGKFPQVPLRFGVIPKLPPHIWEIPQIPLRFVFELKIPLLWMET